jgi:hypothetical protein
LTPTSEYGCDGVSVDPLEVMFVKLKSYMITSEISFSKKALKYQHWQQQVCLAGRGRTAGGCLWLPFQQQGWGLVLLELACLLVVSCKITRKPDPLLQAQTGHGKVNLLMSGQGAV